MLNREPIVVKGYGGLSDAGAEQVSVLNREPIVVKGGGSGIDAYLHFRGFSAQS